MLHIRLSRIVLTAVMLAIGIATPGTAQTPWTEYDGAEALGLSLRAVGATDRVLMIGAHPDDENTALLSTLGLGRGAEVAYLSLTRGEGGQNLLGPELQEALGLLRSEELLAARRLDGARQFFSRAYDFGYSKHAGEAFRHWPRDSLLSDVVAVVRRFRPDAIVSVFSGTPSDGHGQHQAAGIMAREAFAAAGDPDRFPGQIERGLRPHRPRTLYQSLWYRSDEAGERIATGEYDPLLGRSYFQIAMASRSRHRSQDMGRAQPPGPRHTSVERIATNEPADPDGFAYDAGAPRRLDARTGLAERARGAGAELLETLRAYDGIAARLRERFTPLSPDALLDDLVRARARLREADAILADRNDPAADALRFHIDAERADVRAALAAAAGVRIDAVADDERVVPGQTFELALTVWNGGRQPVSVRALQPALPDGWHAEAVDEAPGTPVAAGELVRRRFRVHVPADAPADEPYFLERDRTGDMYAWPADPDRRGRAFDSPAVLADAGVEIAGADLRIRREATFRHVDKARGEVRRPIRVVPAVSVLVEPEMAILPVEPGAGPADPIGISVALSSEAPDTITGAARLELPSGWRAEPESIPLELSGSDGERVIEFTVHPPDHPAAGAHAVRAVFETAAGRRHDRGHRTIDYAHIRPRVLYRPATATVRAIDISVPRGLSIGYIMGAGDGVAAALEQLGLDVERIGEDVLASGDLERYDVILTGIRAYEVRDDLVAHNRRVLDYVRDGGTLVVQYNKYEFDEGDYAPHPLTMARPHDRVTDEAAPVRFVDPDHPVLTGPNRITDADFEGWVQDRGLYFAHTWDDRYTPVLEMNDPGDPPLRGGLLVASHGRGTYVYTGLAFFRQLPEGVPGAYRLLVNLLSLGGDG